jgi:hypothetical protein
MLHMLQVSDDDSLYCFHAPPYNSIDHLHMHSIGRLNERSFIYRIKFNPNLFSFFTKTVQSVIASLEEKNKATN